MAIIADHLFVCAVERVVGLQIMNKGRFGPVRIIVAIAAFLAVVGVVIVIFQVAGNTDRLDLVSVWVVRVAVITLQ